MQWPTAFQWQKPVVHGLADTGQIAQTQDRYGLPALQSVQRIDSLH